MNVHLAKSPIVEIVVLAVVIGILVFVGAVGVTGAHENGRNEATRSALRDVAEGIDRYRGDTGRLPSRLADLARPASGDFPYVADETLLLDGWRRPFKYYVIGARAKIQSAGPDGVFDTADDLIERYRDSPLSSGARTVE